MRYIERPILLENLKRIVKTNKITNIYGNAGSGKTSLSLECLKKYFDNYIIHSELYSNESSFSTSENSTPDIIVFDDYDYGFSPEVNTISKSDTKFIFITREKLPIRNIGFLEVPSFSPKEVGQYLLMNLYHTELIDCYYRKLLKESSGNPALVSCITNILNDTPEKNLDIIYKPCIVDAQGNPIDKTEKSTQIIVSDINDQLLFELSQNPNLLYNLSPYDFERVIAKMFEKKGFSVKITPQTRDGGKDIFIAKNDLCSFLFYVECKKYAPNRPVGIDVIQRLYGVVSAEKATGGIIATTSHFTKSAKSYVQEHKLDHQITLQDYDTITNILKTL